jgi:SAM-dependent methyltransferase
VGDWEGFATADPYFYVCTDQPPPRTAEERRIFFERGARVADELLGEVEADLPGWSTAIEIGCGVGRLLLPTARRFGEVRGVDVAPTMLAVLDENAREGGVTNVRGYLPGASWDEPSGSADYVYSFLVFQHVADAATIEAYLHRIAGALRPGGIAQLQFDTRPGTALSSVRAFVPDPLLPRTQRRGIRRIRRDPGWVRRAVRQAGMEVLRERDELTPAHRFVLRRP